MRDRIPFFRGLVFGLPISLLMWAVLFLLLYLI